VKAVGKGELTSYTKSFVASADGTRIGYRQLGSGPGVVLLHGGVNASQHLMRLGSALAEMFTIGIPGRRGRGVSGPIGSDYSLRAEDEDLAALLEQPVRVEAARRSEATTCHCRISAPPSTTRSSS
jgi:pimeloyl-ACP methyl ester carboxylesterase